VTRVERSRNRRGQGTLLRAEILRAAAALLEQTGVEEAVTLRAVAREVGISAPSIYAHFPDREAIVETVLQDAFDDLIQVLQLAIANESDPLRQLRAGCAAYLDYARDRPHRYRVLFERRPTQPSAEQDVDGEKAKPTGTEAFTLLVDCVEACVDAGSAASTDPYRDATAIWVGLHGYATLRAGLPDFPWPDHAAIVDRLVLGLVDARESSVDIGRIRTSNSASGHPELKYLYKHGNVEERHWRKGL
jgi:AcrR family transcriptional regulator